MEIILVKVESACMYEMVRSISPRIVVTAHTLSSGYAWQVTKGDAAFLLALSWIHACNTSFLVFSHSSLSTATLFKIHCRILPYTWMKADMKKTTPRLVRWWSNWAFTQTAGGSVNWNRSWANIQQYLLELINGYCLIQCMHSFCTQQKWIRMPKDVWDAHNSVVNNFNLEIAQMVLSILQVLICGILVPWDTIQQHKWMHCNSATTCINLTKSKEKKSKACTMVFHDMEFKNQQN